MHVYGRKHSSDSKRTSDVYCTGLGPFSNYWIFELWKRKGPTSVKPRGRMVPRKVHRQPGSQKSVTPTTRSLRTYDPVIAVITGSVRPRPTKTGTNSDGWTTQRNETGRVASRGRQTYRQWTDYRNRTTNGVVGRRLHIVQSRFQINFSASISTLSIT